MVQLLSVTEAVRNFSDVINRVYYRGQTYLLTRGGTVVARLTTAEHTLTMSEWARRWPDRPRLDPIDAARWEEELKTAKAAMPAPQEVAWDS